MYNITVIKRLFEYFKYYGHREKLKVIGREHEVKELNLKALKLAKEVAVKTGTLMAGNICNTTVFQKGNDTAIEAARAMFKVPNLMQFQCQIILFTIL